MNYDVTYPKDLQQPATSVNTMPQNRWVMSTVVTELKRDYTQSEESKTGEAEAENSTFALKALPVRRKSWIPWPTF